MLFKNKYRIESARLPDWDYSRPGYYFFTICTYDRDYLFGTIVDDHMQCNDYGTIVYDEWEITGEKHPNIHLDAFVVMPNHFHGIIRILRHVTHGPATGSGSGRDVARNVSTGGTANTGGTVIAGVAGGNPGMAINPAMTFPTPTETKNKKMSAISPVSGSLSTILRSFKSGITKHINQSRNTPGAKVLQPRFHDHIIRNEQELFRIRQYIKNNPANWGKDKFNIANGKNV